MNLNGYIKLVRLMTMPRNMKELKPVFLLSVTQKRNIIYWVFVSGLREEIADTVLLYEPTTLKQAIKIAKKVEKSIDSQTRVLRPKPFNSNYSSHVKIKPLDSTISSSTLQPTVPSDPPTKKLTLDQKRSWVFVLNEGKNIIKVISVKSKLYMFLMVIT
jgi:hypothetical protein